MGVKLVMREVSVDKRQLMMALEVHCQMDRPFARAPRIELVFENGWDNRRMVMPQQSFVPKRKDKTGKTWVARAKYTFFLRNVFWYGTWEQCRMHIDIDFDGQVYEAVPFVLKLRKTDFEAKALELADEDEDEEDIEEEEAPDSFEFGDNYLDISLGVPVESEPPVQPNKIQVLLGILIRMINGILGLFFIPWYCIDVLGIIFLPTEKKDWKLNQYGFFGKFYRYVLWRYFSFCRNSKGKTSVKRGFMKLVYQVSNAFHRKKKNILFLSARQDELTGNLQCVRDYLEKNPDLELDQWLNGVPFTELGMSDTISVAWKCGMAKIILLDDYASYIRSLLISEETDIIQIWNAPGAFKAIGFSRLAKKGGPRQRSKIHRDYDYCFVSSENVVKYYAEAFGLAQEKVLPLGIPRTDVYFDESLKEEKRKSFYEQYPGLLGKKVILFAPTYRGNGQAAAYYDYQHFDPNKVVSMLPEDHVLIIRHHPFVEIPYRIEDKYKDRICDLSGQGEISDILMVTNVLITDYSSIIYDASLLKIPMLFFAYDLEDYITSRDFYFEYETNVPGKIVTSQEQVIQAILDNDFEEGRTESFAIKNFDMRDGKASERIAGFIEKLASGKKPSEDDPVGKE